jgi:hypothetical protein
MTLLLRILSSVSAFLMIVFFVMPIMIVAYGRLSIRDVIASAVFVLMGVLAMRCTKWLWRRRPFWTETRSLSEVSSLGCYVLLLPIAVVLERLTTGLAKDAIHIANITLVISVYVLLQRNGRTKRTETAEA